MAVYGLAAMSAVVCYKVYSVFTLGDELGAESGFT